MKYQAEMTDTFGGEANYNWVKRVEFECEKESQIVRKAKLFKRLSCRWNDRYER